MLSQPAPSRKLAFLPLVVLVVGIGLWALVVRLHVYPEANLPSPLTVIQAFRDWAVSGRLVNDLVASLFRVTVGFLLAVALSVPLGLCLGHYLVARAAFLPWVNFLRNLSPLAWITFAVLWFPLGDPPVIFLIFLSSFPPMVLAIAAAVANIPAVYFQVGRDYGLSGIQLLRQVTLPAIMPQFITTLRVTSGVAWMVVVAAEMLAGNMGLGFAVWDSRNGLRTDYLICVMIVIGVIGVGIDVLLSRLTRLPAVRWGYEG